MSVLVGLFSLFHKFGGILVCEVPPCLFIGHTPAYVSCDTCQRHKGPGECRNRQTPCRHSSSTRNAFLACHELATEVASYFLLQCQRIPTDSTGTPGMTFPACIYYSVNDFMQA